MTAHGAAAPSEARRGVLAIALAAVLWSLGAIAAGALFQRGMDPFQLAGGRVLLAAVGFAALTLPWRRPPGDRPLGPLIGLGVAIALVAVLFFLAISRLSVAVGTVLHYTAPILVLAWGALVTRRRPSPVLAAAAGLSLAGVILVSELFAGQLGAIDWRGVLFGLGSAACFASYTLLAERPIAVYGPVQALARAFAIAAALWVPYQLWRGWPSQLFEPGHLPLVLVVGIVGTWLPFLCFLWGIQRVQAQRAAVAATLEPAVSAVVSWIALDQALSATQLAGGALIVGAVLLAQRSAGLSP